MSSVRFRRPAPVAIGKTLAQESECFFEPAVFPKAELDALEALLGPELGLETVNHRPQKLEFSA